MKALNAVQFEPKYQQNTSKISDSFRACGGAAEGRAFLEGIIT